MRFADQFRHGFNSYIERRAFRIIPPYWVALAVSCLVVVVWTGSHTGKVVDSKVILSHAFLLQNVIDSPAPNGAFWSIAVEWQIYFVFPLLLYLWRRFGGLMMVCWVVFAVIACFLVGTFHEILARSLGLEPGSLRPLSKLLYLRPQFLALFAFGVTAAHILIVKGWISRVHWLSVGITLLVAMVAVLSLSPIALLESNFFWIDMLAGVVAATLFAGLAQRPFSTVSCILGGNFLRWLGQSSYSLYLIHVPVLELTYFLFVKPQVLASDTSFFLLTVLVVPLAIFVSRLFWRAFERPFLERRSLGEWRVALRRSGSVNSRG